jgi:hypothetical protein
MGRPIVYCGICGKSLKEDDFSKGKAHLVDNAPYCVTCRIVPEPLPRPGQPPTPKPGPPAPPAKPPAPAKTLPSSTPRHHSAAPPASGSLSTGLVVGILVAVIVLLVIVVIVLSNGGPSAPAPETPAPQRRTSGPERSGEDPARAAIQKLEAFASSSSDPDAILARCQDLLPTLRGTPYVARLEAVEARANEARAARDRDRQLSALIENVRKMRELDPRFERRAETLKTLQGALSLAGTRKAEIEKVLADYQRAADEFAAKPPDPPPTPVPPVPASDAPGGSYDLDGTGVIRHWLLLGPFGNRKAREAFQEHDLLKTEADHVPGAGQEVMTREGTKVRWSPVAVPEGPILFRSLGLILKPEDPAIVFAACWLKVEKDCQVKLRMVLDGACFLWLDHQRIWKLYGQGLKAAEDPMSVTLSVGSHLLLLKAASVGGGDFGFRLRVATPAGERAAGIRVSTQPPTAARILYSENFNQGLGMWVEGQLVPGGGVNGTPALAVARKYSRLDRALPDIVGPNWTLRLKMKPLVEMKEIEITIWSNVTRANFRYHVRGLKPNEWTSLELKAKQLNNDWNGNGKTFEGETVNDLRIYYNDPLPDGSLLIDDVEISE